MKYTFAFPKEFRKLLVNRNIRFNLCLGKEWLSHWTYSLLKVANNFHGFYDSINQEAIIQLDMNLSKRLFIKCVHHETIHRIIDEIESLMASMDYDNIYRLVEE